MFISCKYSIGSLNLRVTQFKRVLNILIEPLYIVLFDSDGYEKKTFFSLLFVGLTASTRIKKPY